MTTTYTYNDTLGKPLSVTVNDGASDRVTRLTYDGKGNLKTKLEESKNNLTTELFYDDTYQAFPVKQVVYGIGDADGNTQDLTTQAGYNYEIGLKLTETDARGFTTTYEYDKLNRLIKVTLPDDGAGKLYRQYDFDDSQNTCVFTNEKGQKTTYKFDGLGRLTGVVKESTLIPAG